MNRDTAGLRLINSINYVRCTTDTLVPASIVGVLLRIITSILLDFIPWIMSSAKNHTM